MSLTKKEIIDAVADMSIMDIVELIAMMEDKFGVSTTSAVTTPTPANTSDKEAVEEKTEFDIILSAIGINKVAVIKAVRMTTGLGLKEAKDMVESAPVTIKEAVSKEEAEKLKKLLEEAGASIKIK